MAGGTAGASGTDHQGDEGDSSRGATVRRPAGSHRVLGGGRWPQSVPEMAAVRVRHRATEPHRAGCGTVLRSRTEQGDHEGVWMTRR